VLRVLETHAIRYAYADYWIAWLIVFETREQRIAVPRAPADRPDEQGRYPRFYAAVSRSPDPAHVFLPGTDAAPWLRQKLFADGYRVLRAGAFLLYVRR
jgi:hypothetical protein